MPGYSKLFSHFPGAVHLKSVLLKLFAHAEPHQSPLGCRMPRRFKEGCFKVNSSGESGLSMSWLFMHQILSPAQLRWHCWLYRQCRALCFLLCLQLP